MLAGKSQAALPKLRLRPPRIPLAPHFSEAEAENFGHMRDA